jgi:iron complex outermembrane receptor protein
MIDLLCGGPPDCGVTGAQFGSPPNTPFFSRIPYDFKQTAFFAEGSWDITDRFNATLGARYYDFSEDRNLYFGGIFADSDGLPTEPTNGPGSTDDDGVTPRVLLSYDLSDNVSVNAQAAEGFRLGGINDPLNIPLCTPQDLITFGNRESWEDETTWNYEVGSKTRFLNGNGAINASFFYTDISDLQVTVTAGSCSSRIVFNVPNARSIGGELEFAATLSENFDFAVSAGVNEATLESTLTETRLDGSTVVISGIEEGRRLPGVPDFQFAAAATYQQPVGQGMQGYVTGTYTYIGSRFTQVGDEVPGFGTVDLRWTTTPLGGPLTQTQFHFDPELPSYSIVNLRAGVRFDNFDIAIFGNNLFDERAFLSLDRERGLRARVGYLTNQPQTFGVTTRVDF